MGSLVLIRWNAKLAFNWRSAADGSVRMVASHASERRRYILRAMAPSAI